MIISKVIQGIRLLYSPCYSRLLCANIVRGFRTTYILQKNNNTTQQKKIKSTLYYITAAGVLTVGLSYAAVPLYRMFCQAYSYGGTTALGHDSSKVEEMTVVKHRPIKVKFNADIASSMRWNFKPQQNEITVCFSFVHYR